MYRPLISLHKTCSSLLCVSSNKRAILDLTRGMAGHSKWANIKHNKASQDLVKSRMSSKLSNLIKICIRETGISDPKLNSRLSNYIKMAKSNNISMKTIDNAIANAKKSTDSGQNLIFDLKGNNGVFILVNVLTENRKKTRSDLNYFGKKHLFVDGRGVGNRLFEEKGVIIAEVEDRSIEEAMEHAIEHGAEDVEVEDGLFRFTCHPYDIANLNKGLDDLNYKVTYSNVDYIPNMIATVSDEQREVVDKVVQIIEDQLESGCVLGIYSNC